MYETVKYDSNKKRYLSFSGFKLINEIFKQDASFFSKNNNQEIEKLIKYVWTCLKVKSGFNEEYHQTLECLVIQQVS